MDCNAERWTQTRVDVNTDTNTHKQVRSNCLTLPIACAYVVYYCSLT